MMRFRAWATLIAALACVAATGAGAADIALGKAKAAEVCDTCHGAAGNSTSQDFPKLGGQHRDYIEKTLRDYRSGGRKNAIWRIVVADRRSPRDGRNLETIGQYNPQTDPSTIVLDKDRAEHWLEQGAQPTRTVATLLRTKGIQANGR